MWRSMGFFRAQPDAPSGASMTLRRCARSQKALRIDVDRDLDAAARFRGAGHPGAQVRLKIDLPLRLDEQADAVAAADERERGFGGAEHHDAKRRMGDAGEPAGLLLGLRASRRRNDERGEPPERRQAGALAGGGLLAVEPFGV